MRSVSDANNSTQCCALWYPAQAQEAPAEPNCWQRPPGIGKAPVLGCLQLLFWFTIHNTRDIKCHVKVKLTLDSKCSGPKTEKLSLKTFTRQNWLPFFIFLYGGKPAASQESPVCGVPKVSNSQEGIFKQIFLPGFLTPSITTHGWLLPLLPGLGGGENTEWSSSSSLPWVHYSSNHTDRARGEGHPATIHFSLLVQYMALVIVLQASCRNDWLEKAEV